jgi:cysteine-rich repeat protein
MSRILASLSAVLGAAVVVAACSASSPEELPGGPDSGTNVPEAGTGPDTGRVDFRPDAGGSPVCGNGKIESGETCDDGNAKSDDGCSAACAVESAFDGDTCPGKTLTLAPSTGGLLHATASGTTKGAFNHYGSACGGGSGADVVYTFTPASSGKAVIKLTAAFSAIVSARSSCDVATSEIKCTDVPGAEGGDATMELPVFAGTPVSIIIDGYAGSNGTFTLDVDVSAAVCGNGVAELPESCDDGNKTPGDGCSATCTLEAGGVIDACPGQPFLLSGAAGAPRKVSFAGNTAKDGKQSTGAIGCFYWGGSNVVYALKSDVAGAVKADLVTGYTKGNLHARSECTDTSYQVGCTLREAPGALSLDFPVTAGQWFYLFVDGHRDGSKDFAGPYSLSVTLTPSACGNDVLDGDEECDDGNAASGDGCTATCTIEPTPAAGSCPGHAVALASQADGSRTAVISGTTVGRSNTVAPCGTSLSSSAPDAIYAVTPDIDGYLDASVTGPFNSVLSVLSSCSAPVGAAAAVKVCSWQGNASTDPFGIEGLGSTPKRVGVPVVAGTTYFVVVDSAVSSGAASSGAFELRVKVAPPVCGNGLVEGTETCDDGGTAAGDGCDATCHLEPTGSRSTCADAEVVTLVEAPPGTYKAALPRGTTNLLENGNFFTSSLDDDEPCWAPGRNAFFSVTAPAAGVLRATAKSAAFDVVLGLRRPTCALVGPALACANDSARGAEESLALPVAAGETVWVVVDSKTVEHYGLFTLDVSVTPSGCGDGFFVPSATEECDDGNAASGDGCSATCKLEPKAGVDTCPGTPLVLSGVGAAPRRGSITFSTATLDADYSGACGGSSKEGVVRVTAPISGTLSAKIRNMPGGTVYARVVCNDPSTEFLKTSGSTCPNVVHDVVTFQATAGTDYFLFVDGLDGATGVPTLDVTVGP